jgi:hypothetical protein
MQGSCARYEPSNPSCPRSGDETNDESVLAIVGVKSVKIVRRRICSTPVVAAPVAELGDHIHVPFSRLGHVLYGVNHFF